MMTAATVVEGFEINTDNKQMEQMMTENKTTDEARTPHENRTDTITSPLWAAWAQEYADALEVAERAADADTVKRAEYVAHGYSEPSAWRAVRDELIVVPPFPEGLLPAYAGSIAVDTPSGGEMSVTWTVAERETGNVSARLSTGMWLTVGPNDDDDPVGTVRPFDDGHPMLFVDGLDDTVATVKGLGAAALMLVALADDLRTIQSAQPVDPPLSSEAAMGLHRLAGMMQERGAANMGELFALQRADHDSAGTDRAVGKPIPGGCGDFTVTTGADGFSVRGDGMNAAMARACAQALLDAATRYPDAGPEVTR